MGKKVSWFSAIKKAFSPNSKQKLDNDHEEEKKGSKWGLGKTKHGGSATSFIPLYRKPSSIEKILGDVEREQQFIKQQPAPPEKAQSFRQRTTSFDERQKEPSIPTAPRVNKKNPKTHYKVLSTPKTQQNAATKIQAAFKGYTARRDIRALKGMVRLQGVVRGQNVKRQTLNAMKQMQLLVKVQNQIQLRRINMMENQVLQHKNDRDSESNFGKWNLTQASETDQNEDWDDSLLTKEEIEARMQRKAEALMKRERILAYTNSRQWFKAGSTQGSPMEFRTGALPWWWIRIEQQLSKSTPEPTIPKTKLPQSTPAFVPSLSPRPQSKQSRFGVENHHTLTPPRAPQSNDSTPLTTRAPQSNGSTPMTTTTAPQSNGSTPMKLPKPRINGNDFSFNLPLRDDDSFTSCPPLSRPNYMTPTLSARAKLRAYDNVMDRSPATPLTGKRRLSFPLTQSFGSMGWKKTTSFFSSKDTSSQRRQGNYRAMSVQSIGNLSVDSTTSMPANVGRKPFNRFV